MSTSGPPAGQRRGQSPEAAATDLYRHGPATFARHRDAAVADLQEAGDELGAARVRRLPTPTMAAWWVNQLATRWTAELAALLELGQGLREAADDRDPVRLTELDRTRRVRTDALLSLLWHHGAEIETSGAPGGAPEELTLHVEPTSEDLALVLETVTAAVLDDEVAELVRAGCLARTVDAPELDVLRGRAGDHEGGGPVTFPQRHRSVGTDVLAIATAAVVDAENRLAAATDTVASLTGMLEGLEQELAELARDRESTRARLETWRRTAIDAERELRVAQSRLGRLT